MGGGPELPHQEGSKAGGELLLCVLPWPENHSYKVIGKIKDEFPNLEVHYIWEKYDDKKDRGKIEVPEGM